VSDIRRQEGQHELRIDLPAAHSAGRMGRRMVREFAIAEGVAEGEVQTLEFVAGELLDNAVDHGGGGGAREVNELPRDVRMELLVTISNGSWTVVVADQGGGDPKQVHALIAPEDGLPDLEDERGRGFFLLAQMVDELGVEATADGSGLAFRASRRYAE
jgi:anti-sigma regulatory factor (Ser/Thr protein kinase)